MSVTAKPPPPAPVEIARANRWDVRIRWSDGHQAVYPADYLRRHCGCAICLEQVARRPEEPVVAEVYPLAIRPVGGYGIQFEWSDGHAAGVYTYAHLRRLCPCPACREDRERPQAGVMAPADSPRTAPIPWHVGALLVAATSAVVGVIWDISWHRSIGRDTFWTPAHLAIYLGGALAGLSCGWLVLKTSFAGTPDERAAGVAFWGLRGPLGAWVAIWGSIAMIASAPLDNWWHNAYGLDVKVLSPPHTVLALGFVAIELGALLLVLALQNRAGESARRAYGLMLAYGAGILLQNNAIMGIEQVGFANDAHNALYYQVAAGAFPIVLLAVARAAKLRWPATAAAASYLAISLVMIWALQLLPATPRLAPVFNPLTHMVPPPFPLLLVVPAFGLDLLMRRLGPGRDWQLSVLAGVAFLAALFVTQWFFAEFLLSPHARNFLFGADQWNYDSRLGPWRYEFWGIKNDPVTVRGLAIAAALGVVSARVGLWWGGWMARVKR